MLNIFFQKRSVGIEFTDDSLTLSLVEKGIGGTRLVASETFPFSLSGQNDETLSVLRRFVVQHRIPSKEVYVCIPRAWTLTRFIDIPVPAHYSLQNLIPFEVERHIPFQMGEVYSDYQIVSKNGNAYRVALVIVRKEAIDTVSDFLKSARITPQHITIASFARLTALQAGAGKNGSMGGGKELPNDSKGQKSDIYLSGAFGHSEIEVALMKGDNCLNIETIPLMDPHSFDDLWDEVWDRMNHLLSSYSLKSVGRMLLTGEGEMNVVKAAASVNNLEVAVTGPLLNIKIIPSHKELSGLLPSLGAALEGFGEGKMRVNLLPSGKKQGRKVNAAAFKILLSLAVLLSVGIVVSEAVKEKQYLSSLERMIKKNGPEITAVEKLSTELSAIETQKKFFTGAKGPVGMLDILRELTTVIPSDAWVTNLSFQESKEKAKERIGELTLTGFATSSSTLISLLENSPLFENVSFDGPITKSPMGEGFKLKAWVVSPEGEKK